MDETGSNQSSQPSTESPQQSAYDNNKVIFMLLGFTFLIVIVGAGFYFIYTNLQKATTQPVPQKPEQTQTTTVVPTGSIETPIATTEPTIDDAQDSKRRLDLQQIQNALQKYKAQRGNYPTEITTTPQMIAKEGVNLCPVLTPAYIQSLPIDPLVQETSEVPIETFKDCNTNYAIGYMIVRNETNQITLSAPFADTQPISITF